MLHFTLLQENVATPKLASVQRLLADQASRAGS